MSLFLFSDDRDYLLTENKDCAIHHKIMTNSRELDILYKDDHFVAVNKPAGLMVHRSSVDTKETQFALQMTRDQVGQHVFPVHRLDRPTSGVLLFALDPACAGKTAELFQTNRIRKKYIAVVRGFLPEQGIIDHPVKEVKDRYVRRNHHQINAPEDTKRFPAVTKFKRLAKIELPFCVDKYPTSRYSLAQLIPKTGRRHQLRQHMKHISHHMIGDTRYGKSMHNHFFEQQLDCSGLLLAAVEMQFIHPETGKDVLIKAAPDRHFSLLLSQFDWNIG